MFIGIDIGTSGVKTLIMDAAQHIIASAHADLSVSRPHTGWSEQNPADWINATRATLDELTQSHPTAMSGIKGLPGNT